MVEEMIAKEVFENHRGLGRDARFGVHSGMDKAVRDYIYSRKNDIIERVIDRATKEIVRKGLPKLLERGAESDEEYEKGGEGIGILHRQSLYSKEGS